MSISRLVRRYCCIVAVPILAHSAAGQGFGLNDIGACAIARGFAVSASTCVDGSSIYWNPAALTQQAGRGTLSIGAADIALAGGFRQDTTRIRYAANLSSSVVPTVFASTRIGQTSVGFGIYVPYGLTSQWYTDFPGRFEALKASLRSVYYQPTIAYPITPSWSVGGGLVIGHSNVELIQSQDLSAQVATTSGTTPITFGQLGIAANTEFARAHVKGSDNAFGYNLGVQGKLMPTLTFGARYLSKVRFNYSADARFDQITTGLILPTGNPIAPSSQVSIDALVQGQFTGSGKLTPQTANTQIDHPWQLQAGLGYSGFANTTWSLDVARIGWSSFKTLPLTFNGAAASSSRTLFEDYHDIWAYRLGVEHALAATSGWWHGVVLRGGFSYAQSPAPDVTVTPLLPDMPRRNTAVGLGIPLGSLTRMDVSYLYVGTGGRRGRIVERTSTTQTAAQLNSGAYDLKANVLSLSLTTHM